jgi:hypothetical protein
VQTGDASSVTTTSAAVAGAANPGGAPVKTGFDFGPTAAFGSSAAGPLLGASTSSQPFAAALGGFAPGTTINYRATASSDFTTITGNTKTFTTSTTPVNRRPTSRITGLPRKVKARKLKRIHGTASDPDDGVARVDIAITKATGGAHAAAKKKPRCLRLSSNGRLKSSKPSGKTCKPAFLRASGTTKWKFTLKHGLPKGRYVVYSRATDRAGQRQKGFTSSSRKSLKVT